MMLTEIKGGQTVFVDKIECNCDTKTRLCALGIIEGQEVNMIKNDGKNALILKVIDSRIIIGRKDAEKIFTK